MLVCVKTLFFGHMSFTSSTLHPDIFTLFLSWENDDDGWTDVASDVFSS